LGGGYKMINDGINNVPENTIVVFQDNENFDLNTVDTIISKSPKKRDWFSPHFYRCLPLAIGNKYGFVIKSQYDISFIWDGSDSKDGVTVRGPEATPEEIQKRFPNIHSHFGNGVITINPPFALRTPPGVSLMTINPPNFVIPNITVMTGVVETDNLRRNFTFNLKVQIPNIEVVIPAGYPLAAIIPVPRYFCDSFELKDASTIFDKQVFDEEKKALIDSTRKREDTQRKRLHGGEAKLEKDYFYGKDVYGNSFPDHQKP
jgi:hypothetical protein